MVQASPLKYSFNAGEISPLIYGRVEMAKYMSSCERMENFTPLVQGAAQRRGGTRFIAEVKNSNESTWLIKFEYNITQAFQIEMGDRYMRFYTNRGRVITGSVSSWNNITAYVVGDLVIRLGIRYYCKVANTNTAPPNATYWHPLTDDIYEIPTPYLGGDLSDPVDNTFIPDIQQNGNDLYITHPSYPIYKLTRKNSTNWVLEEVELIGGPFNTLNLDKNILVYASATTGSVTITSSSPIFTSSHVGSLFYMEPKDLSLIKPWYAGQEFTSNTLNVKRRFDGKTYICTTNYTPPGGSVARTGGNSPIHTYGIQADGDGSARQGTVVSREGLDWLFVDNGRGYVKITGYTSPTVVTAVVKGDFPLPESVVGVSNSTFRWAFGSFSNVYGYPSNVTIFRERLTFASGTKLYFSVSGDFENFSETDDSGNIVADRSIQLTITTDQSDKIEWLSPSQALLIGTSGSELACSEMSRNSVFAPGNVKVETQTSEGSTGIRPLRVGFSSLFVTRSGRKLKEITYSSDINGFLARDMSILADHITLTGLRSACWQKAPYNIAWFSRNDGVLAGFTYDKEQDVLGWHRHKIGGSGIVECVSSIPSPDKERDDLWMIVKRTINSQTKRYIEFMEPEYQEGDSQSSCFYVDSGLTYEGTPTTILTGLDHLEGETVSILADGGTHPDRVVSLGSVSLDRPATVAHIGYGFQSLIKTSKIEAGSVDGTSQGKKKRIHRLTLRLYNTLGGYVSRAINFETRTPYLDDKLLLYRRSTDLMDSPPPLFSGDIDIDWPAGWDSDGYITIVLDEPLPMTVIALVPQLVTND